jgi:hypothetical protein
VHVAAGSHDIEHGASVHVTAQSEPGPHETLPLLPTDSVQVASWQSTLPLSPVTSSQVEPPLHSALHD